MGAAVAIIIIVNVVWIGGGMIWCTCKIVKIMTEIRNEIGNKNVSNVGGGAFKQREAKKDSAMERYMLVYMLLGHFITGKTHGNTMINEHDVSTMKEFAINQVDLWMNGVRDNRIHNTTSSVLTELGFT
jgi:hypothetical protein